MSIVPLALEIKTAGKKGPIPRNRPLIVSPISIRAPPLSIRSASLYEMSFDSRSDDTFAGWDYHGFRSYGEFSYQDVQRAVSKRKLTLNESYAVLMNAEIYMDHQTSIRQRLPLIGNELAVDNAGVQGNNNGNMPPVVFLVDEDKLPETNYNFSTNNEKLRIKGHVLMERYKKEDDSNVYFRTVLLSVSPEMERYSLVQTLKKKDMPKKRSHLEKESPEMSKRIKIAANLLQQADKGGKEAAVDLIKQAKKELEQY